MRVLYSLRAVRGTRLDIFGYAAVRKAERALISDYIQAVRTAAEQLSTDNAARVHELAALPEWVRGYEDIKLRSLETYYARRDELIDTLTQGNQVI
ncbi:MAG TPA: hypothetical protein DIW80_02000 [Gordonia polyisoprenivorans]|nr:hypothetical protein [Gordonia polyisoprenivorans]